MSFFPRNDHKSNSEEGEEGEILSSESDNEAPNQEGAPDDIYDSASSEDDKDRLEQEQKRREEFWKARVLL